MGVEMRTPSEGALPAGLRTSVLGLGAQLCAVELPQSRQRHDDPRLALCFYSQVPQSSNRSHQGHGKRRKASGRSCLSAFATACTTAEQEYALLQLPAGLQKLVRAACGLAHAAPGSDERR
jgi:hypothetical protein